MKILLTGATGYIGKRLLPELISKGHEVVCLVRDAKRFNISKYPEKQISIIQADLLDKNTLHRIPQDINSAYYLVHSMSSSTDDFDKLEMLSAQNFMHCMNETKVEQVVYLSGIVNEKELSKHLESRKAVEKILNEGNFNLTTLRAGIILGSGSASFEIIRDLVEKLPLMIAPKWLNTKSQPIAIRNVIEFLTKVLHLEKTYNQSIDIGGPDVLTYKEMLLKFAKVRKLKRTIIAVPIMTPKLSSYWLYFVTSTSYKLAVNLVDSMKIDVTCRPNTLAEQLDIKLISYEDAIRLAFSKIESHSVVSSWIDALSSATLSDGLSSHIQIPNFGCFKDNKQALVKDYDKTIDKIWEIGGNTGWYYADWLWNIRGFMDKMFGGVGIRRGRRSEHEIVAGDALDFWRVLYANKKEGRLLLYAEMKLPGEAWLELKIEEGFYKQTATFRPLGVWGRLYWYAVLPFHGFIFTGLKNKITN